MNISKNIILNLFLFLSTINFAQNKSEIDCENGFEKIETNLEFQKSVSYKVIDSQKIYTEESFEFSEGIILINDLNDQVKPEEIIETIARIGIKNKLTKIIAFRSCDSIELYFQQSELSTAQKNLLTDYVIAEIDIDLYKSLSKKEKKKHKRRRDLIESVSKESCEKLTEFRNDKLVIEKLGLIVSSTSAKYAEKTMEVYETSFEESVDKFLNDLMSHLMHNCKIVRELTKNSE